MQLLERDIEQALTRMIKRHEGLCLKWVCPGWSGVPDRIILLPGGLVLFAELKRPKGGSIRKLQAWWRSKLEGMGFIYWVIKSRADIERLELLIEEL